MMNNQIKPKILLATGLYPPEIGGPATYAKLLNDRLPEHGYEVSVLPFSHVRSLPKIVRHVAYFFSVCKRSWSVDCIFAQDTVSVGLPAMMASKVLGKPFIIRVPGDYAWEQSVQRFGVEESIDEFQTKKHSGGAALLRWLQSVVVRGADRVITPSDYFNELVSGWGVKKEKITTIYNGVDLEGIPVWQAEHGRQTKTIVTAGRLVEWKGFQGLIRMMSTMPDWTLKIVGDGPDRQSLEAFSNELNVSDRVEFTGSIPRRELQQLMQRASAFVLNTEFESFSFMTVEALAVGVPTIVTNVGSLPELITDKTHGRLVRPGDIEEFERILVSSLQNTEVWDAMSVAAQGRSKQFGIVVTMSGLDTLLTSLIEK